MELNSFQSFFSMFGTSNQLENQLERPILKVKKVRNEPQISDQNVKKSCHPCFTSEKSWRKFFKTFVCQKSVEIGGFFTEI